MRVVSHSLKATLSPCSSQLVHQSAASLAVRAIRSFIVFISNFGPVIAVQFHELHYRSYVDWNSIVAVELWFAFWPVDIYSVTSDAYASVAPTYWSQQCTILEQLQVSTSCGTWCSGLF